MLHGVGHILVEHFHNLLLANLIVLVAAVGGDGESWRHGYPDQVHLGKVCTFTTKFLTHLSVTFGLSVAEEIDSFLCHTV